MTRPAAIQAEHVSILDKVRAALRERGEMTTEEIAAIDGDTVESTRKWLTHHARQGINFSYSAARGKWRLRA